jgi:diguanylate cyclase (GGDEF)-like protein
VIKDTKVEKHISKYLWYFLAVLCIYVIIKDIFAAYNVQALCLDLDFIVVFAIINLIKQYLTHLGIDNLDYFYLRSRVIEIFLIYFSCFYLGFNFAVGCFVLGLVAITTVLQQEKIGRDINIISVLTILLFLVIGKNFLKYDFYQYMSLLFIVLSGFVLWKVLAAVYHDKHIQQKKYEQAIEKIRNERNQNIKKAQEHKESNMECSVKLKSLEEVNEQLKWSLKKYYDFHHISNIIGSIYDINGLLKFINETIIEILEADYSTIFLFESKRGALEIQNTNIIESNHLEKLKLAINNDMVYEIIENGTPYVVNFVEDGHDYIVSKEIKSFMCMPISTSKKKYGLVFVESKEYDKFEEENQKLITLIGQQLSTAIENLELYKKMRELAVTDGLTGIYNRLYLQERLSKEFRVAHENDYPLSVVILDIDHFKKFNDTYSHLIGDKVLKVVANTVRNSIRRTDMIARYGGEEFVVIFPNMDSKKAEETCEIIRSKIESTKIMNGDQELSVTASFGVATYPENSMHEEGLLKLADMALYEAKGAGRNCVKVSKEKVS